MRGGGEEDAATHNVKELIAPEVVEFKHGHPFKLHQLPLELVAPNQVHHDQQRAKPSRPAQSV